MKKSFLLNNSIIAFLLLGCINAKETNHCNVSFPNHENVESLLMYIDSMAIHNENSTYAVAIFSKTDGYSINDTIKLKAFMANNILDSLINYPIEVSYALRETEPYLNEKSWILACVEKDTGYISYPIPKDTKASNFHFQIILHLKNNKDSIFRCSIPELVNLR